MTMRARLAAGVFLLVAVLGNSQLGLGSERTYPIPKTLTMIHGTLPIWTSASVALQDNGEPNPAFFGDKAARIREILETPADNPIYYNGKVVGFLGSMERSPDVPIYINGRIVGYSATPSAPGCRDVGATHNYYPDPAPRATLEDAVTHSDLALLGRVTGKAYGFYDAAPGQLLQIEPVQSFGYPLSQPRYYFFVPIGRFRLGSVTICAADQRYAEPPDIGGEVFLFVAKPVDPAGVLLHIFDPGDVVTVNPDGSLRLPRQYAVGDQDVARRAATARLTRSDLIALLQNRRAKGVQR